MKITEKIKQIWNNIKNSDFLKNGVVKMKEKMTKLSKSSSSKDKKPKKTKKKGKKVWKVIGIVCLSLFAAVIVIGSVAVSAVLVMINRQVNAEGEIDLGDLSLNYATVIYAKSGDEWVEYDRVYSAENRTWVDFADIPAHVRYAFIDVEDQNFEKHRGVDWKRTIAATLNQIFDFMPSRQGGSTITQQLVKNLTSDDEISWQRKAREIVRALNLEKRYSKDEIIEAYLNTISLGNNTAGIRSAADFYFGKEPKDLTIAEAASIAALTSMPTYYDPYLNPQNNAVQREYVLSQMLKNGHITQDQYNTAVAEELVFKDKSLNNAVTADVKSYFTDTVIDELIADLVNEKGYSYERAERLVNSGGLQIYTTIDTRIQDAVEQKYLDDKSFTVGSTKDLPQSAFVVLDKNGAIKGIVGGRGEKTQNRGLNRATSSLRQPGSSMKPISVYMPMIEAGMIDWSSIVEDAPVTGEYDEEDPKNSTAYPINVYKGYLGNMTVCEAVQRSTNTIAMKLCLRFTPKSSYEFVTQKLHLKLVREDINGAAMSLGALSKGVSPLQMAAAYLPIMNGGVYYEPHSYLTVYDNKGDLLIEKNPYSEQVVSQMTASLTNLLLQQTVYGPHGTATNAAIPGVKIAGKTGTTDNYHDRWFIGMTPEYLGAVWIGYDTAKEIDVYRISNPARLWRLVMTEVVKDVKMGDYPISKEVVKMKYCTETGLLASDECVSTLVGYYDSSKLPGKCPGGCEPEDEENPDDPDNPDTGESSDGSLPEEGETPSTPSEGESSTPSEESTVSTAEES